MKMMKYQLINNNDDNELFQNAGMVAYDQLFLNRGHLLLSEEEKS